MEGSAGTAVARRDVSNGHVGWGWEGTHVCDVVRALARFVLFEQLFGGRAVEGRDVREYRAEGSMGT